MRERTVGAEPVDGRRAEPEVLRRLAHRQESVTPAPKDGETGLMFG